MPRITAEPSAPLNMDTLGLLIVFRTFRNGDPGTLSATSFEAIDDEAAVRITGTGFGSPSGGFPTVGTIATMGVLTSSLRGFGLTSMNLSVASLRAVVLANDFNAFVALVMGGGDTIVGDIGNDVIRGYGGNDLLVGGGGDDLLDGGEGANRVDYDGNGLVAASGVTVDLRIQGVAQDTGQGRDTLIGIGGVVGTRFSDVLHGTETANYLSGYTGGDDRLSGYGGNDTLGVGNGNHVLDGGEGVDFVDFLHATGGVSVDLRVSGPQTTGRGAMTFLGVEAVVGTAFADTIVLADVIGSAAVGGGGADRLTGGNLDDVLEGDGGDDILEGGEGIDTAWHTSVSTNFTVTRKTDGSYTVRDLRAGSPEGLDTLRGVEKLRFSDKTVDIDSVAVVALAATVEAAFANILRAAANAPVHKTFAASLGGLSDAQAIAKIVAYADQTTSVATLAYQFFTGKIPGGPGYDYLVSPTGPNANNLNAAYYQTFNYENRYINFAVNLGREGEGRAKFAADYGGLTLVQATKKAYGAIFGAEPSDAKVAALLAGGREAYFESYGRDGLNGVGTKAAMVGWLLAEAEKADIGVYARANAAFLTDLADGAAFAVDLIAVYGKPEHVFFG